MNIPDKYYFLESGTVIQEGDMIYYEGTGWEKTHCIGNRVNAALYCRKISQQNDNNINTVSFFLELRKLLSINH